MNGWKALVGLAAWPAAITLPLYGQRLVDAVGPAAVPVILIGFWLAVLWPFLLAMNWSLTYASLRRFRRGLSEGGLPATMEVDWGFVRMRGGLFQTSQGTVRLRVGRRTAQAWFPGSPSSVAVPLARGYLQTGRDVAAHVRSPGPRQARPAGWQQ